MNESRRRDLSALAFVGLVPSILFLDVLLGKGVFYVRDVALYHFPLKRVLRDILLQGEFPYWNPMISAGQPLAANPAHEVFYPLTWLILLPDYIYWFQLLALVHVHIASIATYLLLRSLSVTRASSIVGALAFGLGGFVLSGLQLFPFLFGAAWMPLTFLYGRRAILGRRARDFALAVLFLGIQCLVGEPVVLLQTGLMLGIYAIGVAVEQRSVASAVRNVALVALIGFAALLLSAVQILPAIDHARDSVRAGGFSFAEVSTWSTPPVRFAELLFADIFGSRNVDDDTPRWAGRLYPARLGAFFSSLYFGLLPAVLAIAGVLARIRGSGLFIAVATTSVVLALGSHTPLLRLLYDAGLADSIRYPEKFVIMLVFAAAVFAGCALDRLLAGDPRMRRATLLLAATVLIAAAVGAVTTAMPAAPAMFRELWALGPETDVAPMIAAARTGWLVAAGRAIALLASIALLTRLPRRTAAMLLIALSTIDLAPQVNDTAPRTGREFYEQRPPTVTALPPERDAYRVFHYGNVSTRTLNRRPYIAPGGHHPIVQRNSLVGFASASYGIRTALDQDFDRTSLASTDVFNRAMWRLSERSGDWLNYAAPMSNVWYVGIYRPFSEAVAETKGDPRLIRPFKWIGGVKHPRYYFATEVVPIRGADDFVRRLASRQHSRQAAFVTNAPAADPAPGRVLEWQEDSSGARIEVESRGVGFLVMSVTRHKYWTTAIDGIEVPAVPVNLTYQGVVVPPGRHVVTMRYRNPLIAVGGAISVATLLALAAAAFRSSPVSTMRTL